jgi:hypothetical protein
MPDNGASAKMNPTASPESNLRSNKATRALNEALGLIRGPQRVLPLLSRLASDGVKKKFAVQHLYSYASTKIPTEDALRSVIQWIIRAQRRDGGIAAYYSLLTGYSGSYPEVTGYIVPTLYDFVRTTGDQTSARVSEAATRWLQSLQMPSGAFPAGLHRSGASAVDAQPSVFNTGQILQGLVRAHTEIGSAEALPRAAAAGDWLVSVQSADGSWSGAGAYQGQAHTYYTMVSWGLARLAAESGERRHTAAAEKNLDWALAQARSSGWIDGINLHGHPSYLHFIAYVIQGMLECGILLGRSDAVTAAEKAAWILLRKFETHKRLAGTYGSDFRAGQQFACLTGNAQMSCIWLRLCELTGDLRYLNASLKMNELLKQLLPRTGRRELIGGVAGSYPIWGAYQPLRMISWGAKFLADALMLEQRLTMRLDAGRNVELARISEAHSDLNSEASQCAS